MIARLRGIPSSLSLGEMIVDVGGVGYHVHVPAGTQGRLQPLQGEVSLHIHTSVREDAIQLYGFSSDLERELFQRVISISGVGPKLALSILSDLRPDQFIAAVQREDLSRLTKVSGIGKKTAQRIVLELKNKLVELGPAQEVPTHGAPVLDDLRLALEGLGYPPSEIDRALRKLDQEEDQSLEPMLRKALKLLARD